MQEVFSNFAMYTLSPQILFLDKICHNVIMNLLYCKQVISQGNCIACVFRYRRSSLMLNIFFSLFLFGMLITLCIRVFTKAVKLQQPVNSKEAALMVALSLGCLLALNAGASAVYHTQLISF